LGDQPLLRRARNVPEDVSSEFFVRRTSPDMVVHHVTGAFVAILKSQRVQAVIAATGMSSGVGSIFAGALMVVIPALVALVAFGPAPRSRDTPKVILVTGASSGLGKLMLDELRKAFPASVVYGTSRSGWSAKGTRVTKGDSPLGVTEEDGTQPLLALDVTDEDSVKRCVDAIVARHGELSVLVNNAGAVLQTWAMATNSQPPSPPCVRLWATSGTRTPRISSSSPWATTRTRRRRSRLC